MRGQTRQILVWYRRLIAQKFDGSKNREYPGRPRIDEKLEALIVRMARENAGWGYDRIVGAVANLGHTVSGNILRWPWHRSGTPAWPNDVVEGLSGGAHERDGRS